MKGSNSGPALQDNYAQFIEQLDVASRNLTARREPLTRTLEILDVLSRQNNLGLKLWEERSTKVGKLVAEEIKLADKNVALSELHEVSRRMEGMFLNRTQRIGEKRASVQAHHEEITKSLLELDRSRLKLTSSRTLSRERENLNNAVADLVGTPQRSTTGSTDPGLRTDLNEARRAIVLAEALMEVKRR
ncbi:hypothetical protein [Pseudarthrobacter sulfonivorans]|uniref:hypothetical protein n=1 Tax=Pseudarthrobacter sulfonivorans TaxID=121292 RepID=UPI0028583121|nr:hypothetical protein [Pseudarthrobacter sulfonivorans]MDR6415581.1 hypothetical protein [Pseudarthrobacter sulfonivorans]